MKPRDWQDIPKEERVPAWNPLRTHPRVWLTVDRQRVVFDGDPEAAFLLIGEDDHVPPRHRPLVLPLLDAWHALRYQDHLARSRCAGAARSGGPYAPCTKKAGSGRAYCWQHDPDSEVARSREKRKVARAAAWQDYLGRASACNWVGEGVPA